MSTFRANTLDDAHGSVVTVAKDGIHPGNEEWITGKAYQRWIVRWFRGMRIGVLLQHISGDLSIDFAVKRCVVWQ